MHTTCIYDFIPTSCLVTNAALPEGFFVPLEGFREEVDLRESVKWPMCHEVTITHLNMWNKQIFYTNVWPHFCSILPPVLPLPPKLPLSPSVYSSGNCISHFINDRVIVLLSAVVKRTGRPSGWWSSHIDKALCGHCQSGALLIRMADRAVWTVVQDPYWLSLVLPVFCGHCLWSGPWILLRSAVWGHRDGLEARRGASISSGVAKRQGKEQGCGALEMV